MKVNLKKKKYQENLTLTPFILFLIRNSSDFIGQKKEGSTNQWSCLLGFMKTHTLLIPITYLPMT